MLDEPNENGLYHTLEELDAVKDKIAFMPIEEQAKYADEFARKGTAEGIKDLKPYEKDMRDAAHVAPEVLFATCNATAVGNCALMALEGPEELRPGFLRLLKRYREWIDAQDLTQEDDFLKYDPPINKGFDPSHPFFGMEDILKGLRDDDSDTGIEGERETRGEIWRRELRQGNMTEEEGKAFREVAGFPDEAPE